jgi:hypothetical protein
VTGTQFLWLVLQHVLPKGFRRARNFGFLHPNCKRLIALQDRLALHQGRSSSISPANEPNGHWRP